MRRGAPVIVSLRCGFTDLLVMAFLAVLTLPAQGEEPADLLEQLQGSPDPSAHIRRIEGDTRKQYYSVLAQYDELIARDPQVIDELRRCRFIDEFLAMYEYSSAIEDLYDESAACFERVEKRYSEHPEVILQRLQSTYGEDQLEQGAVILQQVNRESWTSGQLSRLYATLAKTARARSHENAGDYALRALELDETADVRVIAAGHLLDRGERARALEILTSPFDGIDPQQGWALTDKLSLLAKLGARDDVLATHSLLVKTSDYSHTEAAHALREVGAIEQARAELRQAVEQGTHSSDDEKERFRFELELGTPADALAAYNTWRDLGWGNDPLGINRFALAIRHPSLPWQLRDVLAMFSLLGALAICGAALLVPFSFVHYASLARRVRDGTVMPSQGWLLRHAWAALLAFVAASVLALYVVGPMDVTAAGDNWWQMDASPAQLARMTLIESFLALALLWPLARVRVTHQPAWWGTKWDIPRSILVGAAIGAALRVPLLLFALSRPDALPSLSSADFVWQLLTLLRDQFGIYTALWVVAVAAPVIEELVFRGVLLRAVTAHLSFAWANVLQAGLFSMAHLNAKAAVMLFAFGLILGWMTRRSGGLLAAMVAHAVFNGIAAVLLLR